MNNLDREKLYADQVGLAYSHNVTALSAHLLNSIVLIYILWPKVPHQKLAIWLAIVLVIVAIRFLHSRSYISSSTQISQARKWGKQYMIFLLVSGLAWGFTAMYIFPENSASHQIFIAFILGGMIAGASATSSVLKYAFFAFSIPALLPLIIKFSMIGGDINLVMGGMLFFFFLYCSFIARQIYFSISHSLRLRQEKDLEIQVRKKAENELKKNQGNLENLVERRTAELKKTNIDLTKQIQARKTTEEKYQEIFNATKDAIFIHDASTVTILDVNQAMLEMYGYTLEEAVHLQIKDLSSGEHPYTQEESRKKINSTKLQGPQVFEWLAKRKNNELFWVEVALKYTTLSGHQYVIAVVRDIDTRKKAEKNLLKVKKLESIGILAGGIAHDFNNILAAILGNINLARLDADMKTETQMLLKEAEKASIRAKDLTLQLLTFSKGGEPVKETSSLQEVIRDSANFVLHGDKVACQYTIPDNLWYVDIDKGQISQVIQNIIINASQAMPTNGTINVLCENIDSVDGYNDQPLDCNHVKIAISDNGIGIPANVIDKIFDPYFSTKSEGSGLGLAICHSIINKHNGHISVTSEPGKGTTFVILLPASNQLEEKQRKTEVKTAKTSKAKIMIMDDDEMVRNVTKAMISWFGHEVILAKDGVEAIKLFGESLDSSEPIDLTIMDLTIPGGMGGKDAVKEILSINPNAKVIVSSGYSNDPVMANFKEYGFCAAVVKPYELNKLKKIFRQVLT